MRFANVIDDYISKEVFYRGFILRCGHCSNVDWFSVDDVTHNFKCRRCGKIQQYKKANWREGNEPAWFYKLDEIVYLAVANNSEVPILTQCAIKAKCKDGFLFSPELRISAAGAKDPLMEVDICCIADGQLCIGESKSTASLSSAGITACGAVAKYRDLAEKVGATRVIFSTYCEAWDESTEIAIEANFSPLPHIQVSKLTAFDLLG